MSQPFFAVVPEDLDFRSQTPGGHWWTTNEVTARVFDAAAAFKLSIWAEPQLPAVTAVVKMKLHRVLLAGCIHCTRMCVPRNFYPKRLFCSALSSRLGETRTIVLCRPRAQFCPVKYTVPHGNTKLTLHSRSYSVVDARYETSKSQCAAVTKGNVLPGSAAWPGKNDSRVSDNRWQVDETGQVRGQIYTIQSFWQLTYLKSLMYFINVLAPVSVYGCAHSLFTRELILSYLSQHIVD